jgi:hypothetical protein
MKKTEGAQAAWKLLTRGSLSELLLLRGKASSMGALPELQEEEEEEAEAEEPAEPARAELLLPEPASASLLLRPLTLTKRLWLSVSLHTTFLKRCRRAPATSTP